MPTNPLPLLLSTGYFLDLVGFNDVALVYVVEPVEVKPAFISGLNLAGIVRKPLERA